MIRAAYRALMRRYHPDADPSSEASQKAQAINAAYAVLSDPEKRARYDGSLAAHGLIKPEPARSSVARRVAFGPAAAVGVVAAAALAAVMFTSAPSGVLPSGERAPATRPVTARGSLPAKVNPPSLVPAKPAQAPVETASKVSLDEAADSSPDVVLPPLEPVPSKRTVAALPSPPKARVALAPKEPTRAVATGTSRTAMSAQTSPAAPATQAAASCRLGSGWAERTICSSGNLTALDRQLGLLYGQSLNRADEAKRAVLLASRDRFQERRSACRSESCLTSAYVARLREISDIMARGSQQ